MFNETVTAQAEATITTALRDTIDRIGTSTAVVVRAPAGAGKTYFVGSATRALRKEGARVAVCAPTNEQVYSLIAHLARRFPDERVTFLPSQSAALPARTRALPNVREVKDAHGLRLVVGTIDKLGWDPSKLDTFDAILMDEAYQVDAARYYSVGDVAPTHLLVGDPGQLDPFSTMDDPDRWRGLEEDPLQTAVGVLLRNHRDTPVHPLPVTRRLDPRAVRLVRDFYPGHAFEAAVLPGVRELRLGPGLTVDSRMAGIDLALEESAANGWSYVVLPGADVLTADPETISLIVDTVRRLFERGARCRSEDDQSLVALEPRHVAVAVSHNDQKDYLRAELDASGLGGVMVNTANKLQGLQFEVLVAWHPLAGLPDADGFHLDPGRLCVMLTRHRQACIVVGRATDRDMVDGLPPTTPAYLGWDPDPVLDGWAVHQAVFAGLEDHRVDIA